MENCVTMEDNMYCAVCDEGYYLTDAKACEECTTTCTCSASTNKCSGCVLGYKFIPSANPSNAGSCE